MELEVLLRVRVLVTEASLVCFILGIVVGLVAAFAASRCCAIRRRVHGEPLESRPPRVRRVREGGYLERAPASG